MCLYKLFRPIENCKSLVLVYLALNYRDSSTLNIGDLKPTLPNAKCTVVGFTSFPSNGFTTVVE